MRNLKYLLPLLIAPFCFAQGTPNCTLNGSFAANGVSHNFANSTPSCDKWTLTIYNTTLSTFSLTLQSAPAATPSTPGAFVTYIGTTATGSNPLTATGLATFTNGTAATPWLRVSASSITGSGSVYFVLQGSQTVISKGGGGGGGGALTIAGTASEIAVTGAGCTPTNSGTCTISIPSNAIFPGTPSVQIPPISGDNSANIATTNFFTGCVWLAGNMTCPGIISSGVGSGLTGAYDMVGKTSAATSTVSVDDNNTPTTVKLPNDATSGLYAATSPSATPAAGCAQYNGTSTELVTTSSPCSSASYSAWRGTTSNVSMSGTPATIYTFASVPAIPAGLGSGSCLSLNYLIWGSTSQLTGVQFWVDTTQIFATSAGTGGTSAGLYTIARYCNNSGVQNVQTLSIIDAGYTVSLSQGAKTSTAQYSAYEITPTAVDWSTSHTIVIKATGFSGNANGVYAFIN
jgi:hypothetical protein